MEKELNPKDPVTVAEKDKTDGISIGFQNVNGLNDYIKRTNVESHNIPDLHVK